MGTLAEAQRQLLDTALKALDALKVGNIGVMGATGQVLEDSLRKLRDLVDQSLPEIRLSSGMTAPRVLSGR
jgi:hydroxymethylpyrimidine pyrophosphatase-like HAD family hydrolase